MGLRVGQFEGGKAAVRVKDADRDEGAIPDIAPVNSFTPPTFDTALLTLRRRLRWVALLVLVTAVAVEAVLAFRLWSQLTNQVHDGGVAAFLYGLSDKLTAPFRGFEPADRIRDTGIVDISTVIGIEVYLVAAIVALATLLFTNFTLRLITALRNRGAHRVELSSSPYVYDYDTALESAADGAAVTADR